MNMENTNIQNAIAALHELPVSSLALLGPIRDEAHNELALEASDVLGKLIAGDLNHPLAGVYETLIANIARFEEEAYPTESVPPHQLLDFLMDQQGMRQADLAERLGVHQSNVSRMLRGQVAFTTELIGKLSAIFHVPGRAFLN